MKRQIAMILSLFLTITSLQLMIVGAVTKEEGEKVNILSGKSFTDNGYTYAYPAANALDGNSSTFWSSPSDGMEITIDLGAGMRIGAVEIEGRTDMDQSGAQVNIEIQASNDPNFGSYEQLGKSGQFGFLETYHLDVTSRKQYRYLRFKKSEYVCISEFRAYEAETSAADIPEVSYDDVKDENLAHAIGMIGALGVELKPDETGAFQAGEAVTRAEFASLLAQTLKTKGSGVACKFSDMQDHSFKDDVAAISAQGIMIGDSGFFYPDEEIRYEDALVCVLRALGYGEYLKAESVTYCLSIAGRSRLLKDVNTSESVLSRKNAVFLIRNMFETECMELTGINGNNSRYVKTEKLMEKQGFYHETDIMYVNQYYSLLTSESPYEEGNLLIGDDKLQTVGESYIDNIGYMVEYYYKMDNNGNKTLYYLYRNERQKEITVYNDNILDCNGNKIDYWNDKEKKDILHIAKDAIVLYNGRLLSSDSIGKELFSQKTGFVTAISTDGDGSYDVIKIFNGADRYMARISEDAKGYSLLFEGAKALAIGDNITVVVHGSDMISSDIGTVTADTVITVGCSMDGRHYEIYCGTQKLEEVQITTNNGEELEIDYKTHYEKSPEFINEFDIKLRQHGNLYFNYREQPAYFKLTDDYYKNAIVAGVGISGAFCDQVQMKMFTASGSVLVYTLDDNVVIDGRKYTDLQEAYNRLMQIFCGSGTIVEAPIRYKANMNLVIKEIDTLETDTGNEQDTFSQLKSGLYYWMYGMVDTSVYTDANTMFVFKYANEREIEDRYVLGNRGGLADAHNYNFITYGSGTQGRVNAIDMVMINSNLVESMAEDTSLLLVEGIGEGLGKDGEIVKVFYGMFGGNAVKIPQKNSESLSDILPYLSCGDIVRLSLDSKGNAVAGQLIFDYEGEAPLETMCPQYYINKTDCPVRNDFMAPIYWSYGTVYDIDVNADIMEVRCPGTGGDINSASTAYYLAKPSYFSWVYYCDIEKGTVEAGRWQQIKSYTENGEGASKIVVRSYSGVHREMIIYSK